MKQTLLLVWMSLVALLTPALASGPHKAVSSTPSDTLAAFINCSPGITASVYNDATYPWTLRNDTLWTGVSSNGSSNWIATYVRIDFQSSVDFAVTGSGFTDNSFNIYLDGQSWGSASERGFTMCIAIPAGNHSLVFENYSRSSRGFLANMRAVPLSDYEVSVQLSQAGDLGSEVLSQMENLKDVGALKISGPMNDADWSTIASMTGLMSLDMTDAVTTAIPNNGLSNLSYLITFRCPTTLTRIGEYAFQNTRLATIDIPEGVTYIGQYAFWDIDALTSVSLPSTIEALSGYTFNDCGNLKRVSGGANVKQVNYWCFSGCQSLTDVPDMKLITVGDYAFNGCKQFKAIDLTEATTIGNSAFSDCDSLKSVSMPNVSSIASYAFSGCDNLREVVMGSNVSSIPSGAFYYCPIEQLYLNAPAPPSVGSYAFSSFYATVYVPEFAMTSYKLDSYWCQFTQYAPNPNPISDVVLTSSLTLASSARIPDMPNVTISPTGKLTVNGSKPQPFNEFRLQMRSEGSSSSYQQYGLLLSRCDSMTAQKAAVDYRMYGYSSSPYWHYVCLPFDVEKSDIEIANGSGLAIYSYDGAVRAANGAGQSWTRLADGDVLKAGQGYIFCLSNTDNVVMPATATTAGGLFTAKAITTPLAAHASQQAADADWNLVGNPYPCFYDIYAMDYTAPITVWSTYNRTYTAYSVADDLLALNPFQAFFVQKPQGVDAITFAPQGRQLTPTVTRAANARGEQADASNRRVIDLTLTNGEQQDRTRLVVNANRSDDYEAECDASKMMSADAPQLYTLAGGTCYAIQEGPMASGVAKLGLYLPADGSYTIDATRMEGEATLLDQGVAVSMPYTFTAAQGTLDNRFQISLLTGANAIKDVTKQQADNDELYDLSGRRVKNAQKGVYIKNGKKVMF